MTIQDDPRINPCRNCGGTGEAYVAGDEWLGYNCAVCEGTGNVVYINGLPYAVHGKTYRAPNGRFASLATLWTQDSHHA